MSRCIEFVMNEGTEQEQAIAICSTAWDDRNKKSGMKDLESGDTNKGNMKDLEFKSFEILETKADTSGNLTIIGYGARFNNIDAHNDIIQKGAFEKTLQTRAGRIAFCYQHDIWNPIGKIKSIEEDESGLKIEVMISAAEPDIQTKVKENILQEMSIGYRTIESKSEVREGKEVRLLTEIELLEISLVTVASNPLAIIEGMKGEQATETIEKEFNRLIAIIKNENINFEIRKLKGLVLSARANNPEPPKKEPEQPTYTKNELLKFLKNE